jgi:hypothetical protein
MKNRRKEEENGEIIESVYSSLVQYFIRCICIRVDNGYGTIILISIFAD